MTDRPLQKCGPNNEHGLKLRIDQLTGENARLKAELEKVKVERDELLGITQAHEGNIFDMRGVIATLEREKAEQRDRIAELEKDKARLVEACELATCYVEGEAEERTVNLFHRLAAIKKEGA